MRIRSTKPEFWRSKTIAALPWDVRLVLKGLESYVDDNGVGKDDIALIAADVFPRDLSASPRETLARLSEAISSLSDAGLIVRYDIEDEELLYIDRWKHIQRIDKPARGRFRRPDGTLEYAQEVNRDSYAKPRETVASPPEVLAPGTGEQGNRGTGEQGRPATPGSALTHAAEPPGDEPSAQALIAEWIDHCAQRPPSRVIGQLAKEVRTMLNEGIPYERVRAGVQAWQAKGLHPSAVASVVNEVANGRPHQVSKRQAETDALFERAAKRMGVSQ